MGRGQHTGDRVVEEQPVGSVGSRERNVAGPRAVLGHREGAFHSDLGEQGQVHPAGEGGGEHRGNLEPALRFSEIPLGPFLGACFPPRRLALALEQDWTSAENGGRWDNPLFFVHLQRRLGEVCERD